MAENVEWIGEGFREARQERGNKKSHARLLMSQLASLPTIPGLVTYIPIRATQAVLLRCLYSQPGMAILSH